ncbi:MAG TPA: hypothetical protein VMY42_23765 [Thermoguttaceae bacterium]|nr:hypothetical protein [Thermoguttaceae bacterium]
MTAAAIAQRIGVTDCKTVRKALGELAAHDLIALIDRDRRRGTILIAVYAPYPGRAVPLPDPQLRLPFTGFQTEESPSTQPVTGFQTEESPSTQPSMFYSSRDDSARGTTPSESDSESDLSTTTTKGVSWGREEFEFRDLLLRTMYPDYIPRLDTTDRATLAALAIIATSENELRDWIGDAAARTRKAVVAGQQRKEPIKSPIAYLKKTIANGLYEPLRRVNGKPDGQKLLKRWIDEVWGMARQAAARSPPARPPKQQTDPGDRAKGQTGLQSRPVHTTAPPVDQLTPGERARKAQIVQNLLNSSE